MNAQPLPARHFLIDVRGVLKHLLRLDAGGGEKRDRIILGQQALMRHGVDADSCAGFDAQDGWRTRREIAPNDGIRGRAQSSVGLVPCWRRLRRRSHHKGEYAEHCAPRHQRFGDLPGHLSPPSTASKWLPLSQILTVNLRGLKSTIVPKPTGPLLVIQDPKRGSRRRADGARV